MDTIVEAIVSLIGGIFSFFAQLIILLLEFIVALASPRHRADLRRKWSTSGLFQAEIIISGIILLGLILLGIFFLFRLGGCQAETKSPPAKLTPIEQTNEKTEIKEVLKEKTIDFLKEKWKERKERKDSSP